jgi:hypothetical protein
VSEEERLNEERLKNRISKQRRLSKQHTTVTAEAPKPSTTDDFLISTDRLNQLLPPVPPTTPTPIPPPNREPTDTLFIINFVKPCRIEDVKEMFNTAENVEILDCWMDSLKSKCYAKFATPDQASSVRDKVYGKKWAGLGKPLVAEFVEYPEMEKAKGDLESDTQFSGEVEDPLAALFKKTNTKPAIYYLPLTEEQITEKRTRRRRGVSLFDIEEQKSRKLRMELEKEIENSRSGDSRDGNDSKYDRRDDSRGSSKSSYGEDRRRR